MEYRDKESEKFVVPKITKRDAQETLSDVCTINLKHAEFKSGTRPSEHELGNFQDHHLNYDLKTTYIMYELNIKEPFISENEFLSKALSKEAFIQKMGQDIPGLINNDIFLRFMRNKDTENDIQGIFLVKVKIANKDMYYNLDKGKLYTLQDMMSRGIKKGIYKRTTRR